MLAKLFDVSMENKFDYIIVGGGTAGCVLASRLSADPRRKVLLLEAGPDVVPGHEPVDILDTYPTSYYNLDYVWKDLFGSWTGKIRQPIKQAKILGGGSSVMGMVALRGTADDYNEWDKLGASGWDWPNVLPYFRKLESDTDYSGPLHGDSGPVPISRIPRKDLPPFHLRMEEYAKAAGIQLADDLNGNFADGLGVAPQSVFKDRRASASICYLDRNVRKRENLTIITQANATRIAFEGRRATGVSAIVDNTCQHFVSREVIVTAGTLRTPALLMRSGVGPANHLYESEIPVVFNSLGVGKNLQNHQIIYTVAHMKRAFRPLKTARRHTTTIDRYSSNLDGAPPSDMCLSLISQTGWHELGTYLSSLAAVNLKPFSRGQLTLDPLSPSSKSVIAFNFLSDERDILRLCEGVRRIDRYLKSAELRGIYHAVVPVTNPASFRAFNNINTINAIKAKAVALLIDAFPVLGKVVLSAMSDEVSSFDNIIADDDKLRNFIANSVTGMAHPVGTCKMGKESDKTAVVGGDGKVFGLDCLRVADASIMPTIPRGNTNIPTLMIAEKISNTILSE